MKILQINAVYGAGSTGRTVEELDKALPTYGIDSIVAVAETSKKNSSVYLIGKKSGRKFHALFSRITGKQGYFSYFATKRLLKWIKKETPSVIHLRNLHANYVNINLLFKFIRKNNIPTVITLHDCWFFTAKCTHYTEQGCYKWIDGCNACPKLKVDNKSWFFDRTKTLWKDKKNLIEDVKNLAVIGVSDWVTNEATKSFLKSAKILKRIYNWIDLTIFYPRGNSFKEKYFIDENKFNVLCISANWNANSSKLNDLLKLSAMLREDERIILAGNISSDISLPSNVVSIGYVTDVNDLAQLYSSVDVYLHLSHEDTFGKVIVESLACGTPAIVYDATACPELVGDNCGCVVAKGNVEGINKAIVEIKEKGREFYSQNCVNFVKNNFEKDNLIKQYVDVYLQLIDRD